jgi:hypothetical protein
MKCIFLIGVLAVSGLPAKASSIIYDNALVNPVLLTDFGSLTQTTYTSPIVVDGVTISSSTGLINVAFGSDFADGVAVTGTFDTYTDFIFPSPVVGFELDFLFGGFNIALMPGAGTYSTGPSPQCSTATNLPDPSLCGIAPTYYLGYVEVPSEYGVRVYWDTENTLTGQTADIDSIFTGTVAELEEPGAPEPSSFMLCFSSLAALLLWGLRVSRIQEGTCTCAES